MAGAGAVRRENRHLKLDMWVTDERKLAPPRISGNTDDDFTIVTCRAKDMKVQHRATRLTAVSRTEGHINECS